MSKISVLRSKFEGTNWKRSFATRLTELLPDMNPDAADEASDLEFLRFKEVDPSIAAQRWADERHGRTPQTPQTPLEDKPAANAG